MSTPKISATIITLNEEENIRAAIESVRQFCEEIIVVDSESSDRTREFARQMGAKVYVQPYLGDGLQKDYGVQFATNDWIFSIDADERVDEDLVAWIRDFDLDKAHLDAFAFSRKNYIGNRFQSIWHPDYVIRLYDKNRCRYDPIGGHSKVNAKNFQQIKVHIHHFSFSDYHDLMLRITKFSKRSAQIMAESGTKAGFMTPWLHSLHNFVKYYFFKGGFFRGMDGLTVSVATSFEAYMKYAQLYENRIFKNITD